MTSLSDLLRVSLDRLRAARFRSIKAGDLRLGGTLVLFGVTLGMGVMLALTPPSAPLQTAVEPAADRWVGRQTEKPVGSVKIVDAGPRRETPCAEQTWPYIERRCLTIAEPKPAKPQAETTGAGSADMTPVTATIAAPKPPGEAREQPARVAVTSDRPKHDSTSASAALPQPQPQPRPQIEAAIQPGAPEKLNIKPEATPTAVVHQEEKPAPAATPATVTTPALATQQPAKPVLKLTDKVGPAVAAAVAPAKRAQRVAQSKPVDAKPRIVSRWTEKVYDLGDGRTHRVIVVRQGSGPAGYRGARRAWSAYAAQDDED
jgi:hypothetical protein